jgi:hypothetical protein
VEICLNENRLIGIDFVDKLVDLTNKSMKTRTDAKTGKGDQGLMRESEERTQGMS